MCNATKVRLSYEKFLAALTGFHNNAVQEIEDENHLGYSKELKAKLELALWFDSDLVRKLELLYAVIDARLSVVFG